HAHARWLHRVRQAAVRALGERPENRRHERVWRNVGYCAQRTGRVRPALHQARRPQRAAGLPGVTVNGWWWRMRATPHWRACEFAIPYRVTRLSYAAHRMKSFTA